jgi:hypothetical protein
MHRESMGTGKKNIISSLSSGFAYRNGFLEGIRSK